MFCIEYKSKTLMLYSHAHLQTHLNIDFLNLKSLKCNYISLQCGVFEALKCQGQSLLTLAENVEEMYKNYGSLMNLKVTNAGFKSDIMKSFFLAYMYF